MSPSDNIGSPYSSTTQTASSCTIAKYNFPDPGGRLSGISTFPLAKLELPPSDRIEAMGIAANARARDLLPCQVAGVAHAIIERLHAHRSRNEASFGTSAFASPAQGKGNTGRLEARGCPSINRRARRLCRAVDDSANPASATTTKPCWLATLCVAGNRRQDGRHQFQRWG